MELQFYYCCLRVSQLPTLPPLRLTLKKRTRISGLMATPKPPGTTPLLLASRLQQPTGSEGKDMEPHAFSRLQQISVMKKTEAC